MVSSLITSGQKDREIVTDFIFLGSKISADGDCSHEIKRRLLLGTVVLEKTLESPLDCKIQPVHPKGDQS